MQGLIARLELVVEVLVLNGAYNASSTVREAIAALQPSDAGSHGRNLTGPLRQQDASLESQPEPITPDDRVAGVHGPFCYVDCVCGLGNAQRGIDE
jgi:hypothetical protein